MRQEIAVSQETAIASRYELYQYNPDELFTRRGVRVLEKMATTDDMIQLGLSSLKMMMLSAGYQLDAASKDPIDEQIADEVAANLENMEGSLRAKLFSLMGCLDLGASHMEKVWDFWPEDNGTPYAGHVRLVTLKSKNPQWFNPSVDDFNNITGYVMISPPAYGRKLPARKFLVYAPQKRYENVWGTARIRALYDWWYLKGIAKAAIAVLLQKYGKETPIGFVPPTMSASDKQSFMNALTSLAKVAAATMPEGTHIEWMKFDPTSVTSCLAVVEKADQQIIKVLLGQVSSTGTSSKQAHAGGGGGGSAGSNSGGSAKGGSQEQTLNMYIKYMQADVAENPFADLIKEIVDYNYKGVTKYPRFVFKPLSEEDMSQKVQLFIAAATAQIGGAPGVPAGDPDPETGEPTTPGTPATPGRGLVNPTPDDEEWIREVLGAPSINGKNALRPNRQGKRPVVRIIRPAPPVDPAAFPIAGYRPPTPSAPGMPANYAEKTSRELTPFEKSVNFAESWRIMVTDGDEDISRDAAAVLKRAVDKTKVSAKDAMGNARAIRNLKLPYRAELAKVLRDGLQHVAQSAIKQAKKEIRVKIAKAKEEGIKLAEVHNFDGMTPDDVLNLIENQSFTMAGQISDQCLNSIKQIMYAGVKSGESYKDIVYDMENELGKYVDLNAADTDLSGPRLMNAVRTNVSAAYNDARKAVFEDPALGGFVRAYQFSAIMDGDTTPWCAAMDGKIFRVSNRIWDEWAPPTFFQCRSMLIPITKVDKEWDGEESTPPKIEPPDGFN